MKIKFKHILLTVLFGVAVITAIDLFRISSYETYTRKPKKKLKFKHNNIYLDLVDGKEVDWNLMDPALDFINNQYDCSDFRLVNLIRILYQFEDKIPENVLSKIENTLWDFNYWWDEPGGNSMCYWSENHQILFASAEYLVGQKYPDKVFKSGLTGKEHMAKAKKRALDWLEMRWNYGFIEFFSGVYYKEDVGGLINIIDLAEDEELVKKSIIIMDLLFYDVASQSIDGMFMSASGRAYTGNRTGGHGQTLGGATGYYWGNNGMKIKSGMMSGLMFSERYSLPPVFVEIANDKSDVVMKQRHGLDLSELKEEGYFGSDNRSMMMQWGMEAFSNPEIVRNSLANTRNNKMFSNDFIGGLKVLDFTLLRWLHLEPAIVRFLKPQSNGVAIQKGNTYTYKTKDYTLYSAQNHHPGTYGDQQHVAGMNIGGLFGVFHSHPAIEKGIKHQSPNYWVGYGHFPHVAQNKNVSLSIYNIPKKKGMMEMDLLDYTHAYFPKEKFDSVIVTGNYAFGKKGNTYSALIGANELSYREDATDDLIQKGKQSFWIVEAGSKRDDNSFEQFCNRIKENKVSFDSENLELKYLSNGEELHLKFSGDFSLNGNPVNTKYDRYDTPYIKAKIKQKTLTYEFNGKSLHLDFHNLKREMN
jgi:hypothetical protein